MHPSVELDGQSGKAARIAEMEVQPRASGTLGVRFRAACVIRAAAQACTASSTTSFSNSATAIVRIPRARFVVDAMEEVRKGDYLWSGNANIKSATSAWDRAFRRVTKCAEVEGHFHMFRDTFALNSFSPVCRSTKCQFFSAIRA